MRKPTKIEAALIVAAIAAVIEFIVILILNTMIIKSNW